jgi:predicted RNase H-like HicB family nuclease
MLSYPVKLTPDDNGTILVTAPDLPEVSTFGADKADALVRAADAIATALKGRISGSRSNSCCVGAAPRPTTRPASGHRSDKARALSRDDQNPDPQG